MSNPIKYTTGSETLALKKGNFYIGTGDVGKGPSDTTGYYQGPNVPSGGYIIYMNRDGAPGNLSYHTAANDSELIAFTNNLAGQSYTTVNECLVYFAGQSDKMVLNRDYEGIITDGLVLNLDAGFTPSYPRSGTVFYDLSSNEYNSGLVNGPTFNNDGVVFDATDDYGQITSTLNERINWNSNWQSSDELTITTFIKANWDGFVGLRDGIIGQKYYYDLGFSFHIHCNPNNPSSYLAFNIGGNGNFMVFNNVNWSLYSNQLIFISFRHKGTTKAMRASINDSFYNQTLPQAVSVENYMTDEANDVRLIRYSSAGGFREKTIYDLQVYNRWLSDDEVLQNYNAQKGRFGL